VASDLRQVDHFRIIRQHSTVPLAIGELFVNVQEYLPLIKDRLIDFIRVHMSDIGGLTPMIKLAALCEFFGVRVALHGPGDCSPVGMMANLAIDLSSTSFGIRESDQLLWHSVCGFVQKRLPGDRFTSPVGVR
jgi:mannonate dehydratase